MGEPSWLSDVFQEIRRPRIPFAVLAAALCYLLLPPATLQAIGPGVVEWATKFRPWILVAAAIAGALIVYDIGQAVLSNVRAEFKRRRLPEQFKTLSRMEREQLKHWFDNGMISGTLDVGSGVGESLVRRQIMSLGGVYPATGLALYILEPWARDYIAKHPDVLTPPAS